MNLSKNDMVFGVWINSPVGYVKRVARDNSWADICWYGGIGYSGTSRHKTMFIRRLDLNKINGHTQ